LQDQPFQVLQVLLQHPGEVVSREELRQRVWPAETFVDFDQGLNNAIKRLREALSDDAVMLWPITGSFPASALIRLSMRA
jgi:DNA-binding winged helix-turn-helix (wHTH) protein